MCVCAGHVGSFEDTACVNIGPLDDGAPGRAEIRRIGNCASKVFNSQCTKSWLDKLQFSACTVHTQH